MLQASPFCNINCDYCYLPDRANRVRMRPEVAGHAVRRVAEAGLIRERLALVWHAGEPLAVPISWYEEAFAAARAAAPPGAEVVHAFQSNGTLLNEAWCDFLQAHHASIGLSLDGPAHLHDRHRRTRAGRGTHAAALRGARLLRSRGFDFHVISVVTAEALDQADAIFDFFEAEGIARLGFNIEEAEGAHPESSLTPGRHDARVRAFFERLFQRQKESGGRIRIREFDQALALIRHGLGPPHAAPWFNEQIRPFGIINVDHAGNFSTFSPELLGLSTPYGIFSFGNVEADALDGALAQDGFQKAFADIRKGVDLCVQSCPYFAQCGGGAPANKLFENGTFASAETMYCRYTLQIPLDIVLQDLERSLT